MVQKMKSFDINTKIKHKLLGHGGDYFIDFMFIKNVFEYCEK